MTVIRKKQLVNDIKSLFQISKRELLSLVFDRSPEERLTSVGDESTSIGFIYSSSMQLRWKFISRDYWTAVVASQRLEPRLPNFKLRSDILRLTGGASSGCMQQDHRRYLPLFGLYFLSVDMHQDGRCCDGGGRSSLGWSSQSCRSFQSPLWARLACVEGGATMIGFVLKSSTILRAMCWSTTCLLWRNKRVNSDDRPQIAFVGVSSTDHRIRVRPPIHVNLPHSALSWRPLFTS